MEDPEEDGNPDHYRERWRRLGDNRGVHINSSIANHAFYLLAEGGMNASCAAPSTHRSFHCRDRDVQDNNLIVTGIGMDDAAATVFAAFTALPETATFCDARAASETVAQALYGAGSQQAASTRDAWVAVGLTDQVCG
jgi:thermolysin